MFKHAFVVRQTIKEVYQRFTNRHGCVRTFQCWWKWEGKRLQKTTALNATCSEQEVSDGGEQLGQLRLDVVGLSDGVAAEIKMLQLGAGGQRLKVCHAGDFWTSELKRKPRNGAASHSLRKRGLEG